MSRQRFNFETKEWEVVDKKGRDAFNSFFVHEDTIPLSRSHADGQFYDSKSNRRKAAKAAGCYELGPNDPAPTRRARRMESPKDTIIRLMNGG